MADPSKEEAGDDDEVEEPPPEVLTEEEKLDRIRAVKFPVIPEYAAIMQSVFPLFVRKGAKDKTELHEKEVGHMMRSLAFNPTDEQIDALSANARCKEIPQTTKQHFKYDNFEQRVMEFLFFEPNAFKRHQESKIMEALLKLSKGQKEMDALELKKLMTTRGPNPFTEEEATKMLRIARDKDTGKVYLEEYAKILATDGLPAPADVLEPIDERFQ